MKRLASLCLIVIACGETEPENQSPTAVGTIPDVDMTTLADTAFDVAGYFSDDDGDTLMYRAEAMDRTVAHAVVSGAMLRLTTYAKIGSTDIKVVAMDPDSAEASLTVQGHGRQPAPRGGPETCGPRSETPIPMSSLTSSPTSRTRRTYRSRTAPAATLRPRRVSRYPAAC